MNEACVPPKEYESTSANGLPLCGMDECAIRNARESEKLEPHGRRRTAAPRVPRCWREWPAALAEVWQSCNHRRPREALEMQRPAQRCQRVRAAIRSRCALGISAGQQCAAVEQARAVVGAGQRWFVCEALAEKPVLPECWDSKLLVSYRNMYYIREISVFDGGFAESAVGARRARMSWHFTTCIVPLRSDPWDD